MAQTSKRGGRAARSRPALPVRQDTAPARREPIEVAARSFQIRLPDHAIYGGDANDPGTRLMADLLDVGAGSAVLIVGGGSGLLPVVAARLAPKGSVVVFADQVPQAEQVEEALRLNQVGNARVVRAADLSSLEGEEFDAALLGTTFEPSRETLGIHARQAALRLRPGGRLYLHGGKREGIESAAGLVREILGHVATLGYRKGHRVLVGERGESVNATREAEPAQVDEVSIGGERLEIETRPGVFAGGALDEGTRLLVESLEVKPGDEALDLGCGSGIVGLYMARRATEGRAVLVDSDLGAIELSRRNAKRNSVENVEVLPSDGYSALAGRQFDLIASNPPFHVGRIQSPAIVQRFVADAPAYLKPGGRLYLVANAFLRYESLFSEAFDRPVVVAQTTRYRVIRATLSTAGGGDI